MCRTTVAFTGGVECRASTMVNVFFRKRKKKQNTNYENANVSERDWLMLLHRSHLHVHSHRIDDVRFFFPSFATNTVFFFLWPGHYSIRIIRFVLLFKNLIFCWDKKKLDLFNEMSVDILKCTRVCALRCASGCNCCSQWILVINLISTFDLDEWIQLELDQIYTRYRMHNVH